MDLERRVPTLSSDVLVQVFDTLDDDDDMEVGSVAKRALCASMGACRLWKDLAEPLVYRSIIFQYGSSYNTVRRMWDMIHGQRGSDLALWIRTFEWISPPDIDVNKMPQTLVRITSILSKAVNLRRLRLPHIYDQPKHSPLSSIAPMSMRVVKLGMKEHSTELAFTFIEACNQLEELHLECGGEEGVWPTARWMLPLLRVFSFEGSEPAMRLFTHCKFPQLKRLTVRRTGGGPKLNGAPLTMFLDRSSVADYTCLSMEDSCDIRLISLVTSRTLDLVGTSVHSALIRAIPPCVRTLVIKFDGILIYNGGIADVFDPLLDEGISITAVVCQLQDRHRRPQPFTWTRRPDWFYEEDDNSWHSLMSVFRGYALRLAERGIELHDPHGHTLHEAEQQGVDHP